jgi:hypothetical protein
MSQPFSPDALERIGGTIVPSIVRSRGAGARTGSPGTMRD